MFKQKLFSVGILKVNNEKKQDLDPGSGSGYESGSITQSHGSADPDPLQNVMDPEHWSNLTVPIFFCRRKLCQIVPYLSSIFAEGILVKLYRTSLQYLRIRYRTEMLDARMTMK
jgi:hypothetical protein